MRKEKEGGLGCWRDKTYCASPNCTNECGRKMGARIKYLMSVDEHNSISYAYFCGEPENDNL